MKTKTVTYSFWICDCLGWKMWKQGTRKEVRKVKDAFLSAETLDGSDKFTKYILEIEKK